MHRYHTIYLLIQISEKHLSYLSVLFSFMFAKAQYTSLNGSNNTTIGIWRVIKSKRCSTNPSVSKTLYWLHWLEGKFWISHIIFIYLFLLLTKYSVYLSKKVKSGSVVGGRGYCQPYRKMGSVVCVSQPTLL